MAAGAVQLFAEQKRWQPMRRSALSCLEPHERRIRPQRIADHRPAGQREHDRRHARSQNHLGAAAAVNVEHAVPIRGKRQREQETRPGQV